MKVDWTEVYDRSQPDLAMISGASDERLRVLIGYAENNVGLLTVQSIMAPEALAPRLAKWARILAALIKEREARLPEHWSERTVP